MNTILEGHCPACGAVLPVAQGTAQTTEWRASVAETEKARRDWNKYADRVGMSQAARLLPSINFRPKEQNA